MSFLKAEWRKLAIANYIVDKSILKESIPKGTELDIWNGNCYISFVGFMFINTSILGIKVPFHTNFEEVNLRFYVLRKENNKWKRGVVFIREFVPKIIPAYLANMLYKEHYKAVPMEHVWNIHSNSLEVKYTLYSQNRTHTFNLITEKNTHSIEQGSEEEFITEHYWGYTKVNEHKTFEYQVTHPRWDAYSVIDHTIDVDFGILYGEEFSFLSTVEPSSVMLAEGSAITVENKTIIL